MNAIIFGTVVMLVLLMFGVDLFRCIGKSEDARDRRRGWRVMLTGNMADMRKHDREMRRKYGKPGQRR
jgi:hypothetical protein